MVSPLRPPAELADEAIVARLAVGDDAAFGELVDRHRATVYGVLRRAVASSADADDLFQETWLRVVRGASRFDPSRPFTPWLRQVATNAAMDWLRRRQARPPLATRDDEQAHGAADVPLADAALGHGGDLRAAQAAMANLPPRLREALLLRYFDDLSEREMAARLAVPAGTVKSRLHHALAALRATLRPDEETP